MDPDKLGEALSAYLDDELTDDERAAVERLLAKDPQARRRLEMLRETVELVGGLPRRSAPPSMLDDLTAAVERRQLLGEPQEHVIHRPWWVSARTLLSAAAAIAITVGGGWYVFQQANPPAGPTVFDERPFTALAPAEPEETASRVRLADKGTPTEGSTVVGGERGVTDSASDDRYAAAPARPSPTPPAPTAVDTKPSRDREGAELRPESAVAESSDERSAVADASGAAGSIPPPGSDRDEPTLAMRHRAVNGLDESAIRLGRVKERLTLEQKIEAGFRANEIANHSFDAESNALVVYAADQLDEYKAKTQIADFALSNSLVSVTKLPAEQELDANKPVFVEGRQMYNYEAPGETQYAMRIPKRQLGELVELVSHGAAGSRSLRLEVGPIVAENATDIQNLVAQTSPPQRLRFAVDESEANQGRGRQPADKSAELADAAPAGAADGFADSRTPARSSKKEEAPDSSTTTDRESLAFARKDDAESAAKSGLMRRAGGSVTPEPHDEVATEAMGEEKEAPQSYGQPTSAPSGPVVSAERTVKRVLDSLFGVAEETEPQDSGAQEGREFVELPAQPGRLVETAEGRIEGRLAGTPSLVTDDQEFVTVVVQILPAGAGEAATSRPALPGN